MSVARAIQRARAPVDRRSGKIGLRISGLVGGLIALVVVILVGEFRIQLGTVLNNETRKRAELVGTGVASDLAHAFYAGDFPQMQEAADAALRDIPDVVYVVLRDGKGNVLAKASALRDVATEQLPLLPAEKKTLIGEERAVGEVALLPVVAPVYSSGEKLGEVQIGLSLQQLRRDAWRITLTGSALGAMVLVLGLILSFAFIRWLTVPVAKLAQAAATISHGDLSQALSFPTARDEIGALAQSFSDMSGELRAMLLSLHQLAAEVEVQANEVRAASTEQSAMATEQMAAIQQTSTTALEIAQFSKQATEKADSVIAVAQHSEDLSRDGQNVVTESKLGMDKLVEQVRVIATAVAELINGNERIGEINSSVKDLAEQSNMLALNASIEAAKAGDQGVGFSVVANEMRNLATQSKVAADEVRKILSELQKGTRSVVVAAEEGARRAQAAIDSAQRAGASISGLADVIRESSLSARQIADNTRQQTTGVDQIVSAVSSLSAATAQLMEGTQHSETSAGKLFAVSTKLSALVKRYRV